jgi:hypothetical protein
MDTSTRSSTSYQIDADKPVYRRTKGSPYELYLLRLFGGTLTSMFDATYYLDEIIYEELDEADEGDI